MHFLKVDDMTIELAGVKGRREVRSGERIEGRQGSFLDGISTPLSSNMTLQSVEQTDKETRSFLVSLSLGPLVHFPVECFHFR